ncbi:hypothetical protein [Jannaschia formosa]|uniref:hypothetical protein n=1 Tax=Jannaschia formosa TaxID=2259592 RepID=UPI001074A7FF|nr:hypothetical protein [Jannaschia formosa]TFL19548.1 hypothetical protein DR046_03305 [Jannaschia formosa]
MDIQIERETVEGGTLVRDARTGKLISVHTDRSESYVDPESRKVGQAVSRDRRAAMERLLNR